MSDASELLLRLSRQNLTFITDMRTPVALLKNNIVVARSHGILNRDTNVDDLIKRYSDLLKDIQTFNDEAIQLFNKYTSLSMDDKILLTNSINTHITDFDKRRNALSLQYVEIVLPKGGKRKRKNLTRKK